MRRASEHLRCFYKAICFAIVENIVLVSIGGIMKKILAAIVAILFIGASPVSSYAEQGASLPAIDFPTTRISADLDSTGELTVAAPNVVSGGAFGQGLSLAIKDVDWASTQVGDTQFRVNDGPTGHVIASASGFTIERSIANDTQLVQSYLLSVESNAHLDVIADGFLLVDDSGARGTLSMPWAKDARGASQPTHFELRGSELLQIVEPLPSAVYPLIADPQWGYAFTYTTKSSPNTNWIKIHNCFNCYFPVAGAPASYPAPNELLPLVVYAASPLFFVNMECRMGTTVVATQDFSWSFRATANHYDGYGSRISFNFRYINNVPSLVVSAVIVNDRGQALNAAYTGLAQANWQTFANNLDTK